jgi:microcystin-dependent protein
MASTFSPNLNLELQGTGDNPGTWGGVLNTEALSIIDQSLGRIQTLSLSSTNVTVTTDQSQSNGFLLTGTLTGNVAVIFPSIGRTYFVQNNTTGAFAVTLQTTTAGATVTIPQGDNGFYIVNDTDVIAPSNTGVPTGAVQMMATSTVPSGWLECNGAAVSRSTYARLFAVIGTTFGAGNGTTTFNLPDVRGYFMRGWDNGRGVDTGRVFGSNQAAAFASHTHTGTTGVESNGHSHTTSTNAYFGANSSGNRGFSSGDSFGGFASFGTGDVSATHTHSFTTAATGGTETRPINVALLPVIKT